MSIIAKDGGHIEAAGAIAYTTPDPDALLDMLDRCVPALLWRKRDSSEDDEYDEWQRLINEIDALLDARRLMRKWE